MCVIGGVTPITLEILRLMRMVYRVTTAGEVEYHITLSEDLPDTATAAPPLLLPPYHTFPHHLNHHLLLLAWSSIPPLSSSSYKGWRYALLRTCASEFCWSLFPLGAPFDMSVSTQLLWEGSILLLLHLLVILVLRATYPNSLAFFHLYPYFVITVYFLFFIACFVP